jgi:hypothetical protein
MIDPKRWLDGGSGASFEERELLQAGRDLRMPDTLRKRVWVSVATGLTAIETAAAAGAALQKGAAAKGAFTVLSGTAAKGVTALAIASGVGLGVASLRSPSEPPPESHVARVAPSVAPKPSLPARSPAEAPPVAELLPQVEPDNAASPESATPSSEGTKPRTSGGARKAGRPSAAPVPRTSDAEVQGGEPNQEARRASRLAEESAAVVAIRKTLLSGEPTEALRMLERARVQFPDGVLGQEREALSVRALVESGQKAAARKRGEAFLRAFPRSPHAAELRALLGP